MDNILGLKMAGELGELKVRLDAAEINYPTRGLLESTAVPTANTRVKQSRLASDEPIVEIEASIRRERLTRLLDREQAWYDVAHEAAQAAERLLSLCEQHQQLWLQSPTDR